jgi:hypothetical protein
MKVRGLALAQQDGWRNIPIALIDLGSVDSQVVQTLAAARITLFNVHSVTKLTIPSGLKLD